jgi:hypothetical protein
MSSRFDEIKRLADEAAAEDLEQQAAIADLQQAITTKSAQIATLSSALETTEGELDLVQAELDECRAGQPSPTPEPEPEPEPEPPVGVEPSIVAAVNGPLLFDEDFEANNFRKWSGAAPLDDPNWNGQGQGGAVHGSGGIVTGFSRRGQRCYKMEVDPAKKGTYFSTPSGSKSGCANWWKFRSVPEGWCSIARYFLPNDWPDVNSLIWQSKSSGAGNVSPDGAGQAPFSIQLMGGTNARFLRLGSSIGDLNGKALAHFKGFRMPKGNWFELAVRLVHGKWPKNGHIDAWVVVDGKATKVFDLDAPTTDGDYGYLSINNYVVGKLDWIVAEGKTKCHIFVDDIRVTRLT